MIEEQELVARVLAGDVEAETEFYNLYKPRLLRASIYFLGTQDSEAEDIVQDTFVIAFPKLESYIFYAPIYAWLRQICLRLCYARMRTRKRVLMSLEEDLEMFMQRMAVDRIRTDELAVQKEEQVRLLRAMIQRLSPDNLQIIDLRDMQGMSYLLISKTLNIPIGTVMSRLARARNNLRILVEKEPEESLTIQVPNMLLPLVSLEPPIAVVRDPLAAKLVLTAVKRPLAVLSRR